MKDEAISLIVNEVIKRIMILLNTHKCLILLRKDTDFTLLNMLLLSMEDNGFIFDTLIPSDYKEEIAFDEALKVSYIQEADWMRQCKDLYPYEVIIISNLNIIEITKLTHLNIENDFLYLVFDALKEGKTIYGFSNDLDIKNNINLKNLTLKLSAALEDMGLKIITKNNDAHQLENHLITLEQVANFNQGSVIIHKNAILTNAAKDYLSQNKMEVIRR